MKRALGLIFITAACIAGFLSIRGTMPFMPVIGSGMEPELQNGSLLIIDAIDPQDVAVDDIIVYSIPNNIREYYDYPPVVAHHVISVHNELGLSFRTAGAITGKDPFLIRPQDIRGTVGNQIPYLGLPLMIFQSQQSLLFAIFALILLAFFLYSSEIKQSWHKFHRRIFSPVINEEQRANWMISRKIDAAEQKMTTTENVLEKFATAIADYAQHMDSHTSAIQGLSAASHELKRGAAEQNRILMRFMETTEQSGARPETPAWKIEPSVSEPAKPAFETEKPTARPVHKMPEKYPTQFPPGCARNRRATANQEPSARLGRPRSRQELIIEALDAEKKILGAIKQLYNKLGESSS